MSSFGVLGFDSLLWKWSIFHAGTRISAGQGKGAKARKIPGNYTKDERKWKASIIFAVFKALAALPICNIAAVSLYFEIQIDSCYSK
jgi:hypothetical protein